MCAFTKALGLGTNIGPVGSESTPSTNAQRSYTKAKFTVGVLERLLSGSEEMRERGGQHYHR